MVPLFLSNRLVFDEPNQALIKFTELSTFQAIIHPGAQFRYCVRSKILDQSLSFLNPDFQYQRQLQDLVLADFSVNLNDHVVHSRCTR